MYNVFAHLDHGRSQQLVTHPKALAEFVRHIPFLNLHGHVGNDSHRFLSQGRTLDTASCKACKAPNANLSAINGLG